jgi:hypothetical protein
MYVWQLPTLQYLHTNTKTFGSWKALTNVVVERLTLLLNIQDVTGSNLGKETGYPDCCFRDFTQFIQANAGIVP